MAIHRRGFLKSLLAGISGLLLNTGNALGEVSGFDPYKIVPLGKTSLSVSFVGFGTGFNGFNQQSNQTRLGEKHFQELIRDLL